MYTLHHTLTMHMPCPLCSHLCSANAPTFTARSRAEEEVQVAAAAAAVAPMVVGGDKIGISEGFTNRKVTTGSRRTRKTLMGRWSNAYRIR